ncbi:ankyrin repeat-containing domain protein [Chaetomidium leptoderma]|uniref:Ankyrin repeat-containing domain protein n=1 Tax=Chaetomidium leptoderma TaxID=669021 RepID=A0AAN6VQE1_9PEZI|nr:ankyrin repeat-containing domain protein [Chaetomidium leptoderma]
MFVAPDMALERRRAQNRIAQRRCREKQRKAAAGHERESVFNLKERPPAREHVPALDLDHHDYDWETSPRPEDGWWSVEPVTITMSKNTDHSPSTSHPRTATQSPSSEESVAVSRFDVSKGTLLSSRGLLMGDINFLSFDQAPDLHGRTGSSRRTHAAAPPPHRNRASRRSSSSALTPRRTATATTVELLPRGSGDGIGIGGGGNADDGNETPWLRPLHMAAVKGHDRIVRMLLGHTADANEPDGHGRTPVMHAVAGGFEDVLQTLLACGARVADADREGRSALYWAVAHRRESLLRLLLDHCRSSQSRTLTLVLDQPDASGKTPLHLAIDMGFEAGVMLLLENGADPSSRAPCVDG